MRFWFPATACFLVCAMVSIAGWADSKDVCHVGAQLHLQKGVPDETYLRHLRAFVGEGLADYALLLAYTLDDADREAVARYLKEQDVHFLVQDRSVGGEWHFDREDFARMRAIAGDLFLGIHWGELDSSGMVPEDYVQLEVDWAVYPRESLFVSGTGTPEPLLPWGQALKSLYSVTRAIGPRGKTVTPFAILLGHENGWPGVGWRIGDVRSTGLFDGIRHAYMQTRDADLSLKLLDVFYPGGDSPYRRDATMKNPDGFTRGRVAAQGTWEGWRTGGAVALAKTGDTLAWSFALPPKSFVLFEFSR